MRMLDMLRAMDTYSDRDNGGAAELALDADDVGDGVTCHTCGVVVDSETIARQTMADGSLMWEPFCRKCLVAGLKRLDAELRQPGEDTAEG